MRPEIGVDEVTALLLDERDYDRPLREKEFHKLLYFVKQELEERGIDADIPYYWYLYGTVTPTSDTQVSISEADDGGSQVDCPVNPNSVDASAETVDAARDVVKDVLLRYYEMGGLQPLTDRMYEDAPYQVQREFRELDKQLRTAAEDHPDIIDEGYNRDAIRSTLSRIMTSFPTEEFGHLESDLYLWYNVMSTELDQPDEFYSVNEMLSLSGAFWTIFMVEVAQKKYSDIAFEKVREEIGDGDVNRFKERMRTRLEDKKAEQIKYGPRLERDETVRAAQDAVSEALVGFSTN